MEMRGAHLILTCFSSCAVFALFFSIRKNRDCTIFSGKFAAYLGPKLEMSPDYANSSVQLLDCYPPLLFHVDTIDVYRVDQKRFQVPGKNAKQFRSTGSVLLNPPSNGETLEENRQAQDTDSWP